RRRHTRFSRDWSSDVCSSDLMLIATSPQQLDLLKSDYDVHPSRIRMIPPGYDDNRFFPVSMASREVIRHRLGFEGKVITSIGRQIGRASGRERGYNTRDALYA